MKNLLSKESDVVFKKTFLESFRYCFTRRVEFVFNSRPTFAPLPRSRGLLALSVTYRWRR
jgi:hypothetical protein